MKKVICLNAATVIVVSIAFILESADARAQTAALARSDKTKTCAFFLKNTSFWHLARKTAWHMGLMREVMVSGMLEGVEIRRLKHEKAAQGFLPLRTPHLLESGGNEKAPYRSLYALSDGGFATTFQKSVYSTRKLFEGFAARKNLDPRFLAHAKQESFEFVEFGPGKFMMGSPKSEENHYPDERQHAVVLTKPFEICRTPVTQAQWYAVKASNPARFKESGVNVRGDRVDPNKPIENVSWFEAQEFILALNESQGKYHYRLPTEAEWECAARAGTATAYFFGDNAARLSEYAHFGGRGTTDVASRKPNPAGLFDMSGNVEEWMQDCFASDYPKENNVDPSGPSSAFSRVLRGGSWYSLARSLRLASRDCRPPGKRGGDAGFRLARTRRK